MRRYMHECVVAKSQAAQEFGGYQGFPAWDFLLRRHEKCLDAKKTSSSDPGFVGSSWYPTHWSKLCVFCWDGEFFGNRSDSNWFGDTPHQKHQIRVDHDSSFFGRHATNLWTWNDEENLLRNTISQGLQREVARSPLCCKKSSGSRDGVSPLKRVAKFYNKRDSWIGTTWDPWSLLGQWLNFKLFGITYNIYLAGKIKFKLLFQGPLAMSGSFIGSFWILLDFKVNGRFGARSGPLSPQKNRSPDWILIETT